MSPDHPIQMGAEPAWVQYSVAPTPRRKHPLVMRVASATAAIGAVVSVAVPGAQMIGPRVQTGRPHVPAPPARDAAVFRYPLGCLGAAVTPASSVARPPPIPDPCFHYGVYVTAVLKRSGDIWRLGLKAISPACPAVPLPRAVRAELVTCERPPRILTGF